MGLKATIQNRVVRSLFSPKRRDRNRQKAERQRAAKNLPHVVEYFHEVGDPYSHLLVQVLPEFVRRYNVEFKVHLVPPPPDWAAPDRDRLETYARRDAAMLAAKAGLAFQDPGRQPSSTQINAANEALLSALDAGHFLEQAFEIGQKVWRGELEDTPNEASESASDVLLTSAARRDALGHYLGGTLYYAGEWYWGLDRLHFLEARLGALGVRQDDASKAPIFAPPAVPVGTKSFSADVAPVLHWYVSFRSPYTGIVRDRVKALADAYGAELKIRYVLPMVMRGMQVPRKKGFYIMSDTVREAERLGVSFGNSVDPVGEPVERGYAILHEAIRRGKGYAFANSFLSGVWADGLDAGSDRGLKTITERAGLSWQDMKPLLGGDHWREEAEANQQEMFSYGIWGVPSFRVGEVATWGQDRLWVIEDALKALKEV